VSGGARGAHMHDSTRVIWRLVRDAGKAGIALDELVARQPLGRQETRSRLQTLTRSGYCTRKDGDGGFTWFEGEHCVPGEEPGGDDDADDGFPPPAPAPKGPPPGVPSCVWDLGKVPALSADATPLATAKRPDAVPPAPPPAPLPVARVVDCLDGLVRQGQLHHGQRGGRLFYGVQVEGVPLPCAPETPAHPTTPTEP
jgi:hypothetical protein